MNKKCKEFLVDLHQLCLKHKVIMLFGEKEVSIMDFEDTETPEVNTENVEKLFPGFRDDTDG